MSRKWKSTGGIAALFVASVLHAGIIGGLILLGGTGTGDKGKTVKAKDGKIIPVSLMVLPKVNKRGQKSVLKEKNAENDSARTKEEFGTGAPETKQAGTETEEEMLTYMDMVKQKIQEERNYPYAAKWKGAEGSVGVNFYIGSSGEVMDAEIYESSGEELLDREALETVGRASPFPPVPGGSGLKIQVSIIFKLN